MTSWAQVTALVDAHVNRDYARFRAVTLQIAAHARSEQSAEHLRRLVERQQAQALTPLPSANGLLSMPTHLATLDDLVLAPATRDLLDRVVREHDRRLDLMARGLHPARKLLFTGPPGVGKTMSAGALANAVKLPLFRVELHGVIGSYLGETSGRLAKVFDHVRDMPGVYLFDEFDALGGDRSRTGDESAGGEMRRVVNSLLQFIEDDRSDSLIVAATNYAQRLDPAIFRRFDEAIAFAPLTIDELVQLAHRKLDGFPTAALDHAALLCVNPTLSHADFCVALDRVRKSHVLDDATIDTDRVAAEIARRVRPEVVA